MFTVCACARHQVTPKECHLHAVKRIFRCLKGHPKLGLWYPKDSPFDLVAFSDSDYGGATQDRKSTSGGEPAASDYGGATQDRKSTSGGVASCCGQVLRIQNQLLDYGHNFMNTNIYIDNDSAICIVKIPVYHSKTKHIEIRHHFIRDCFEKKLINMDHIHTDENVSDLLTKPFDAGRFQYLVSEHNADFHPIVDFIEASPLRVKAQEHQLSPITQPIKRLNHISSSSIPTVIPIPTVLPIPIVTQSEPTPLRHYTRRVRIAQSSTLPPIADEPASPVRDVSKGEACLTDSGFIADQDRAT
nr:hypothetical protein [Tanacetum cinerariifolium]